MSFLGLKQPTDAEWAKMSKEGPRVGNVEGRVMPKEEKEALAKLYRKPNSDLATLLNDSRWLRWNSKYSKL